ncbi:MAG: hypothetical protein P8Q26_16035 [Ascidiaceihabitans sp.]|nr:hypothetical protein [Ascidiaceihabitans sp.]
MFAIPSLNRLWILLASACCFPTIIFAQPNKLSFRCIYQEQCGTLVETACLEPGNGFLLKYEQDNGFSAVMDGETWRSEKLDVAVGRNDLTVLAFGSATGETAMLSLDQEWNFAMTVHYTGQGDGIHWLSGTGNCEALA